MSDKSKEVAASDIKARLKKIVYHVNERQRALRELQSFTTFDFGNKHPEVILLAERIQNEELGALYELVHLRDNVLKFLAVTQCSLGCIKMLEDFKLFRVASNVVNSHKHGTRGKNRPTVRLADNTKIVMAERETNRIADLFHLINCDGNVLQSNRIIRDLTGWWQLFLTYHTDLDLTEFFGHVCAVFGPQPNASAYVAEVPKGIEEMARAKAAELRQLNL